MQARATEIFLKTDSLSLQEHYNKHSEGDEEILNIAKEEDPFWEPIEDVLIGTATFYLQPLSYKIEVDDTMAIYDYKVSNSVMAISGYRYLSAFVREKEPRFIGLLLKLFGQTAFHIQ